MRKQNHHNERKVAVELSYWDVQVKNLSLEAGCSEKFLLVLLSTSGQGEESNI